jgi:hypothetical protein
VEKAGDILKNIFNNIFEHSEHKEGEEYHTFFDNWEKTMGSKLSQHSKPVEVKDHFLLIEVDHPGWLQIIQINERSIVKKIRAMHPQLSINYIKIKLVADNKYKKSSIMDSDNQQFAAVETFSKNDNKNDVFEEVDYKIIESINDLDLQNSLKKLYINLSKKKD